LELAAQRSPEDAKRQAALYRVLVQEDPDALIRRFEDQRWARDQECTIHYLCALYETSQLERAVQNFVAKRSDRMENPGGGSNSIGPATISSPAALLLGTKERPLYVHSTEAKGGKGWRRLGTAFNIFIVGSILYSLFAVNEQRLESLTGKVHHIFKKDTAERVYTFADVQGCDEAKHELEDLVAFLKNPGKFTRLGARMPKGVLLVGPPGNGKTLLAKAVAGEADVPFFYASGSSFDELFVGVGSMRIRKLFEQAKAHAPSIVFIDELDAVGSKRNPRDPQHSRMSLNQLLTELDGFAESAGVVVIAATNIPEALDKALLRPGRFDKQVYVAPPDMRGRKMILEMYLRDVCTAPDVDLSLLARSTPGFSGADLAKLVNEAKIAASIQDGQTLWMHHLEASKDEMLMGVERKSTILTDEDRLLTAYHEGGHALVALRTNGTVRFCGLT
jgi:ATP-dependent metalloprotease